MTCGDRETEAYCRRDAIGWASRAASVRGTNQSDATKKRDVTARASKRRTNTPAAKPTPLTRFLSTRVCPQKPNQQGTWEVFGQGVEEGRLHNIITHSTTQSSCSLSCVVFSPSSNSPPSQITGCSFGTPRHTEGTVLLDQTIPLESARVKAFSATPLSPSLSLSRFFSRPYLPRSRNIFSRAASGFTSAPHPIGKTSARSRSFDDNGSTAPPLIAPTESPSLWPLGLSGAAEISSDKGSDGEVC